MLETVKGKTPSNIRYRWQLQKFHYYLHVSRDTHMFESAQNWGASPGKHKVIDFANILHGEHKNTTDGSTPF